MTRRHHFVLRAAAVGLALLTMTSLVCAGTACKPGDAGCAMFNGQRPLTAHLRDDVHSLPSWTTRCVNCHAGESTARGFAPPLTHDSLLGATRRRGGPISHYDEAAFCRALKDGVDPAGVLLRKAMPRYRISDAECMSLWRFAVGS